MEINSNTKLKRREMLARISRILIADDNLSKLNRVPLEMRPKRGDFVRCCLYRDRATIKYKIMAMLGFQEGQEDDELRTLESYFIEYFERKEPNPEFLNVVDEACTSCQKNNYIVTNMCRGCVGRPCMLNCPKNTIEFVNGQAKIIQDKCVNCGICMKVCPFHAIIYNPVPCEEACPVSAIKKDEYGKEKIDLERCILCGKCLSTCPYGAIVERTELFQLIRAIKSGKKAIAMLAPAVAGQFKLPMPQIMSGFKALGFHDVAEVARGADMNAAAEALEFMERPEDCRSMTTSCCPSYVEMIARHSPELLKHVSTTPTPMELTARELRKKFPDALLVFVSPCVSKKGEALRSENVDCVISIEEFGAWLVAANIELAQCGGVEIDQSITSSGRNYARTGGVGAAVAAHIESGFDFETATFNGIDKSFLRKLKPILQKNQRTLVEVMACEEGCMGGCNVIANSRSATNQLKQLAGDLMPMGGAGNPANVAVQTRSNN